MCPRFFCERIFVFKFQVQTWKFYWILVGKFPWILLNFGWKISLNFTTQILRFSQREKLLHHVWIYWIFNFNFFYRNLIPTINKIFPSLHFQFYWFILKNCIFILNNCHRFSIEISFFCNTEIKKYPSFTIFYCEM